MYGFLQNVLFKSSTVVKSHTGKSHKHVIYDKNNNINEARINNIHIKHFQINVWQRIYSNKIPHITNQ